jgi:DNA repair ATPase RecN
MTLTIADVGVLVGIIATLVAACYIVIQGQISSVRDDLKTNFENDETVTNGLGQRVDSLTKRFDDYRVTVSDNYVKKEEIKELQKEVKAIDVKIDSYHIEATNQYKNVMDALSKLIK